MTPLHLPEIEEVNRIQDQFKAAYRAYRDAYDKGGECGQEREAYYAARRVYNNAVALAQAALRAEIAKWR